MEEFELVEGFASLEADQWNRLVEDQSPFLEWEWLASLEHAGAVGEQAGWIPRPLVVRDQGEIVAACPLYIKLHSEGEFVFDWGWASAAQRAGIDYYPKMLVAVPFTPVTGARFLFAPGADRARWMPVLASALRDTCHQNDLSGVHVNFCLPDESRALEEAGYKVRVGMQYHWHNHDYDCFDDYLSRLRSKRRNQIRREQRELEHQRVVIEKLRGDDIPDELFESMYQFYLSTVQGHYYGRQYLNFPLFELLRDRFRDRLVFIVAMQEGKPIAGTFNVTKGDALYGRYWGATRQLRHLHFNVCYYAAIQYCIESRLRRVEPGAGGEHKHVRGFDAPPTHRAPNLSDPRLARAVEQYLDEERQEMGDVIDSYRDRSALKQ
jgi:predicted N-acyltransferase